MPTYDYECSACSHKFEIFEKIHAESVKPCPKCGKKRARRLLGIGAGVIFRGSGFYVTDNKKGGPPPAEPKAESKSEAKTETKTGSKPESKPAEPAKKKTTRKEKK